MGVGVGEDRYSTKRKTVRTTDPRAPMPARTVVDHAKFAIRKIRVFSRTGNDLARQLKVRVWRGHAQSQGARPTHVVEILCQRAIDDPIRT